MRRKAGESLESANLLFERGLVDSAANRYYYAMFQAAVHALETRLGKRPADFRLEADVWEHGMVQGQVTLIRSRRQDLQLFSALRGLRVRADYTPVSVERDALESRRRSVAEFVAEVTS